MFQMELNRAMDVVIRWCLMLTTLVYSSVRSQRLVVNTTCLELAKPSNQQRRLSCDNPHHYHCLIDDSHTKEFEMCRGWKWIPEGDCAYFNSFGQGNIDRIECKPLENVICPEIQYPSYENMNYIACYVKRNTNTDGHMETASSPDVSPYVVSVTSDRMNTTFPPSSNIDKTTQRKMKVLASFLGILVPILTLSGIYFVYKHSKGSHHCKAHGFGDPESNNGMTSGSENAPSPTENVNSAEQEPLISAVKTDDIPQKSDNVNETNAVIQAQNCESGNAQMDEKSAEESEERDENKTTDANDDNHGKEEEIFQMALTSPSKSPPGSRSKTFDDLDNDHASDYESTEVFDDTIESLQRGVTTEIDEQEVKHCHQLHDLLDREGWDLIQEVLRLVITRTAGKTPEELLADETVKNELKKILPEESHRIITNPKEGGTSIGVLYGLIQLYSSEKPKSGWGTPVKGSDTGIADDVERLYRVFRIREEISNPVAVSVDNYAGLFDMLLPALTRLDSDAELKDSDGKSKNSGGVLKEKYKALADKLKAIINPTWKLSAHKAIYSFVKHWSPWYK